MIARAILASVCETVRSSYIDQIEEESTQSTLFNTPNAPFKKDYLQLRAFISLVYFVEDRLVASEVGKDWKHRKSAKRAA